MFRLASIDRLGRISVILSGQFFNQIRGSRTIHEGSCNSVVAGALAQWLRQQPTDGAGGRGRNLASGVVWGLWQRLRIQLYHGIYGEPKWAAGYFELSISYPELEQRQQLFPDQWTNCERDYALAGSNERHRDGHHQLRGAIRRQHAYADRNCDGNGD